MKKPHLYSPLLNQVVAKDCISTKPSINLLFCSQQVGMMISAGGSSALLRKVFHDALADELGDRRDSKKVRT